MKASEDMTSETGIHRLGRRAFLQGSVLTLASTTAPEPTRLFADQAAPQSKSLRIALVTDLHYADKPPAGTRHYRETLRKLRDAAQQFEKDQPDFVVELGDLIDAADSVETELEYLNTINGEFSKLSDNRHYVLGNHCVDTLTKGEFLKGVGQEESYYSFDRGDFHFVVLDACFDASGQPYERKNFTWTDTNIPTSELKWLQDDLRRTERKTIVFAHQRLDVSNNHGVKNNMAVRGVLESSGKVLAVFQGHSHQNDHRDIGGIHYCTLVAMVEGTGPASNGYATVDVTSEGTIHLRGFHNQANYQWRV
jgi:predicted MPP superfamily phosphohydrolase